MDELLQSEPVMTGLQSRAVLWMKNHDKSVWSVDVGRKPRRRGRFMAAEANSLQVRQALYTDHVNGSKA